MIKKILILGSTGLLGTVLSTNLNEKYKIIKHSHTQKADYIFNASNKKQLFKIFNDVKPDIIINCIAIADVDYCENNKVEAKMINEELVKNICEIKDKSTWLIHFSTDHVYNKNILNSEDNVKLTNYYSITKYNSEKYVLESGGLVLRANFFGKTPLNKKYTFSDWLIHQVKEKNKFKIVDDIYFSPISFDTLIEKISIIIEKYYGINNLFNIGSSSYMSKYEFAKKIFNICGYPNKENYSLINSNNFFKTKRPSFMQMDIKKITQIVGSIPSLDDEISNTYKKY